MMSMGPCAAAEKALWSLAPGSYQSHLSASDKGYNEAKLEAVHKSPDVYLMDEENYANLSCESVRLVIVSNRVPTSK